MVDVVAATVVGAGWMIIDETSRVSATWQRVGRIVLSASTFDASEASICDHVDENACFQAQTLRASHATLGTVGLMR